jgi:hypothetical protein
MVLLQIRVSLWRWRLAVTLASEMTTRISINRIIEFAEKCLIVSCTTSAPVMIRRCVGCKNKEETF